MKFQCSKKDTVNQRQEVLKLLTYIHLNNNEITVPVKNWSITNLCLLSADTYIGLVGLSLRLPSAFTSESSSNILPSKTSLKQSFPTTLANCKLQTKAFNYRIWKSIKIKFKIHLNHPSKQLFCDKMMFIFKWK